MLDVLQWTGTAGILFGLYLMERKSIWSPIILGVGAVLMGIFGVAIEAYGIVATNAGAVVLNIRTLKRWHEAG